MALSKIKAPSIADDSITVDQIADNAVHGRRNLVINGAMQVAQRSTSTETVSNGNYETVDRFIFYESTDGVYTCEQSSTAPSGFGKSLKLAVTTADSSLGASQYAYFFQAIEGQNLQHLEYGLSSAKDVTLSFWVRSSKTGTYCITLEKHDNTRYHYVKEYTINSADTWEKKEITISPTAGSTSFITASAGAIGNDNTLGARLDFWLAAGSSFTGSVTDDAWSSDTNDYATSNQVNWMDSTSNDFYLTGIQLEVGDKATPFEHRSYGEELLMCQRYFCKKEVHIEDHASAGGQYQNGSPDFVVQMRATPTITLSGTRSSNINSTNAYDADQNGCRVEIASTAAGRYYHLDCEVTANAEL